MRRTTFHIEDRTETEKLGRILAGHLEPGDVVGLCGDLGAGKTFLAQSVVYGLGVPGEVPVTSPTFTLIKEYVGRLRIFHMDLYRLNDPSELYDLGLWEYYDGQGICLVEWCDRFDDLWPPSALVLTLVLEEGEQRTVHAAGQGRGAELVDRLASGWGDKLD
ncbi:MAG: tRNA (adenosine(37)-N6)-threonylcarbamoyltransferase complex ATPase subunit type 1 TsaE [Proteobacteria bacterium]|nr:tRNA (adenosine(37)-N6)-threonylcarbamoyltransferase complex ATPase subunit type 1 TsaE [Pseudomonadota bacterium]